MCVASDTPCTLSIDFLYYALNDYQVMFDCELYFVPGCVPFYLKNIFAVSSVNYLKFTYNSFVPFTFYCATLYCIAIVFTCCSSLWLPARQCVSLCSFNFIWAFIWKLWNYAAFDLDISITNLCSPSHQFWAFHKSLLSWGHVWYRQTDKSDIQVQFTMWSAIRGVA